MDRKIMFGTQKKKVDIFDMKQIEESSVKNDGIINFL